MSDNAPTPEHVMPTLSQAAGLAVKGAVIGIAEAIPGVSGGTVALILGVYQRLIESVKSATPSTVLGLLKALPRGMSAEGRPDIVTAGRRLHLEFLIPLLVGMAPAFLVGTKVLPSLMEEHRALMQALFFGMILASVYVPYEMIRNRAPANIGLIAVGAVAAYLLIGVSEQVTPSPLFVFFFAALAICALILPGVSGSYLLHSVGLYTHISGALHGTFDIVTLGSFAAGALVGLVTFVRFLSWMLRRFHDATLSVLTGLMIGSLRSVWFFEEKTGEVQIIKGKEVAIYRDVIPDAFGSAEMLATGAMVLGFALVVVMMVVDRRLSARAADTNG